ncbi:type IV pilin-like G/H family protein [Tumidithrix elongata]
MKSDRTQSKSEEQLEPNSLDLPVDPTSEELKSDIARQQKASVKARAIGWSISLSLIAVLGVIAIPSFLNTPCKAKQTEARTYVGSLNKGQQAYFTENSKFGSNIDVLGVGIKNTTPNYSYSTHVATSKSAFSYGISNNADQRSYVGAVFAVPIPKAKNVKTLAILCEANALGAIKPIDPFIKDGIPTCGANTQSVSE